MGISPDVGKALVDGFVGLLDAIKLYAKEEGYRAVGATKDEATPVNPSQDPDIQPRPVNTVHTVPTAKPTAGQTQESKPVQPGKITKY